MLSKVRRLAVGQVSTLTPLRQPCTLTPVGQASSLPSESFGDKGGRLELILCTRVCWE